MEDLEAIMGDQVVDKYTSLWESEESSLRTKKGIE